DYYLKAIEILKPYSDYIECIEKQASCYKRLGEIYSSNGDKAGAISYYEELINSLEDTKVEPLLKIKSEFLMHIGALEEPDSASRALAYYTKAVKSYNKVPAVYR